MSKVVDLTAYRAKKEQPKNVPWDERIRAKQVQSEQIFVGLRYINMFPRATFPNHEPPGAA